MASQLSEQFTNDILIVDDNFFNILAIKGILKPQHNLESDYATCGQDAIVQFKVKYQRTGSNYKLILMDYSMPEMDGPEAAKEILEFVRTQPPAVKRPYICCFSAYQDKRFNERALAAGMD